MGRRFSFYTLVVEGVHKFSGKNTLIFVVKSLRSIVFIEISLKILLTNNSQITHRYLTNISQITPKTHINCDKFWFRLVTQKNLTI
ncbi:MAG: hypothetical protein CVU03_02070 [Bacteroidetes bacterium HGW-Bacteroidetes-2]|nr:MAG: hypothetical protein CVU03_02070 [Bacteroidetes bacterium HGW-Bacteroidetes-2]